MTKLDFDTVTKNWTDVGRKAAKEGLTVAAQAITSAAEVLASVSKSLKELGTSMEDKPAEAPKTAGTTSV